MNEATQKLCKVTELPESEGKRFIVNGEDIAVFKVGEKIHAIGNICPHQHAAAIYTGFKPTPEPGHEEVEGETHLLPIELCFNIYESLKTKRSLKSPWTGFSVRPLTDAERAFFPTAKKHHGGVAVEEVWENSPAQRMELKEGDILVQFSYNRILSVADFQKWLYMYGVGQPVKLMFLRNGTDYLATDYTIEERPQWAKPK